MLGRCLHGFHERGPAQGQTDMKELVEDPSPPTASFTAGVLDGFGHVSVRDPRNAGRFIMAAALAPGRVSAATS